MYNGTYDLENYLRQVDRMDEMAKQSGCKNCGCETLEQEDEFCSGICFNEYERNN